MRNDILYLHEFRGFNNSFLELGDVNFFIGENSTGKTSILKILKLITSADFWMNDDFSLRNAELGYYDEIANNINGNVATKFEIGYYSSSENEFYRLVYINNEGYPLIKEFHFKDGELSIQFIFEKNDKIRYRFKKNDETFNSTFDVWVKGVELNTEKFEDVEYEENNDTIPSLYLKLWLYLRAKHGKDINLNIPSFSRHSYWSSPIRSKPNRIYDGADSKYNTDGSHTPFTLRDLFFRKDDPTYKNKKEKVERILNKFGNDSGLYESLIIKPVGTDNLTSPFRIEVKIGGKILNFTNVGYGVSQIMPLIVEIALRDDNSLFLLQQPEVHLHPKGQAAFGDFLLKSYSTEKKVFIVETHSDYLIDRFRIRLNQNEKKDDLPLTQIVFFSRSKDSNKMEVIKIDEEGRFQDEIPQGYRDFFIREQLDLLNI